MAEEKINALNISKVKDVTKLTIKPNAVLIKVTELKKTTIIGAEKYQDSQNILWNVFMVGANATRVAVGDMVLDVNMNGAQFLSHGDDKYIIIDEYNITLSTPAANYEL